MTVTPEVYQISKATAIQGRYIVHEDIQSFLEKNEIACQIKVEGTSVLGKSIQSIELGYGPKKILMWSQMHGNESTTTKAVLDLLNFLSGSSDTADLILKSCTMVILPMLNPDGAAVYTRVNANQIDLNRDALQLTQPESVILRNVFEAFRPNYCFNLHDQRTIFNVGGTPKPATVSFLAPASDEQRSISPSRAESMRLIAAMNADLQKRISGQVGRYDDSFNANCVGDTFQMTNTPTILFEAGHYQDDYNREDSRQYIFHALATALHTISTDTIHTFDASHYGLIPENGKLFLDVLIYNAHILKPSLSEGQGIGIYFVEKLKRNEIVFEPKIEVTGDLTLYYGHRAYNTSLEKDLKALKENTVLNEFLQLF